MCGLEFGAPGDPAAARAAALHALSPLHLLGLACNLPLLVRYPKPAGGSVPKEDMEYLAVNRARRKLVNAPAATCAACGWVHSKKSAANCEASQPHPAHRKTYGAHCLEKEHLDACGLALGEEGKVRACVYACVCA